MRVNWTFDIDMGNSLAQCTDAVLADITETELCAVDKEWIQGLKAGLRTYGEFPTK
jgi:hypothetical protein